MNTNRLRKTSGPAKRHRQRGALTVFSAILILILMTVALLYSTRNALFDQRVSSNEQRSRIAFNMAEAAVGATVEALTQLSVDATSGSGLFAGKWTACANGVALCTADLTDIASSQYIYNLGDPASSDTLDVAVRAALDDLNANQPNATTRLSLALQANGGLNGDQSIFMIYGYGYSDCTDVTDLATCQGRASVAQPLATFPILGGTPEVPLTSRTAVELSGGMTVVANPNAGGVGVPVSIWVDATEGVNEGNGTWQTCELEEWYGTPVVPADSACPGQGANACNCTTEESLSRGSGNTTIRNIDLLEDPNFPDDLFLTFFGVPKAQYQVIKNVAKVLDDCGPLSAASRGLYWIDGDCRINAQQVIGSADGPVIVVVTGDIDMMGGTTYGVIMCTDAQTPGVVPDWQSRGNTVIYGSVIVDCNFVKTNGTFDLVYAAGVLANASGIGGVAAANGGWRDFDVPAFVAPAAP